MSKKIEVAERRNLTRLKHPGSKKGLPRAIVLSTDYRKERDPPVKSKATFANEKPSQL